MSVLDILDLVITQLVFMLFYSKVQTTVTDNNDGSYAVSYTPMEQGSYSVWVCVKAQHVKVTSLIL